MDSPTYRDQAIQRAASWALRHGVTPFEFRAAITEVTEEEHTACRMLLSGVTRQIAIRSQPGETGRARPQAPIDPASVDPWDESPEELRNETRQIVECHGCGGHGEVTCPACGGTTRTACGVCGGSGKQFSASRKRVRLINCRCCPRKV